MAKLEIEVNTYKTFWYYILRLCLFLQIMPDIGIRTIMNLKCGKSKTSIKVDFNTLTVYDK